MVTCRGHCNANSTIFDTITRQMGDTCRLHLHDGLRVFDGHIVVIRHKVIATLDLQTAHRCGIVHRPTVERINATHGLVGGNLTRNNAVTLHHIVHRTSNQGSLHRIARPRTAIHHLNRHGTFVHRVGVLATVVGVRTMMGNHRDLVSSRIFNGWRRIHLITTIQFVAERSGTARSDIVTLGIQ